MYLTSIMDLYSRKIIAWKLTKTMKVEEVLKCLEEAKRRRKTDNPVVIPVSYTHLDVYKRQG